MAGHMRRAKVRPQLVLCSSAARALQTYEAISAAVGPSVPGLVEHELYGASDSDLRVRLHEVPDTVEALLVIGHNPGLQDLALGLAGDGDEHALARLGDKFATCALATLDIPTSWAALGPGPCLLEVLGSPPGISQAKRNDVLGPGHDVHLTQPVRAGRPQADRSERHLKWVMTRAA